MRQRTRKLIGAFVTIGFVVVYALVAMALAQARPVQDSVEPWRTVIYAGLGLFWALPMAVLIKWMAKPDRD